MIYLKEMEWEAYNFGDEYPCAYSANGIDGWWSIDVDGDGVALKGPHGEVSFHNSVEDAKAEAGKLQANWVLSFCDVDSPPLSAAAVSRLQELAEVMHAAGDIEDSQIASDITVLLDYHEAMRS